MAKDGDTGDAGEKNLDDALSGETGLQQDQIEAFGGELDDDLDGFDASKADRGDSLEPPKDDDDSDDDDKDDDDGDSDDSDDDDGAKGDDDSDDDGDDKDSDAEDDSDADGDDDSDDDDKDEDDAKSDKKKPDNRIPKDRFDEVNARRKKAEDELATLKAEKAAGDKGEDFDFDAAEIEYMDLLLDGKSKEALAVRKSIDAAKEAVWESKQTIKADNTVTEREVKRELDGLVAQYEGEYDVLNKDTDDFSEDVIDDVQSMFRGYLQTRDDLTPGQAFSLAVNNAVRIYGLEKNGEAGDTTKGDEKGKGDKKNTRTKDKKDVKGKIKIAKKAPKDLGDAGNAGDSAGDTEIDLDNLTDAEMDALPESTLARLRGDFI